VRALGGLLHPKHRLDLVAGCCDGILTALTLAAGRLIDADAVMGIGLALRVAAAAAVSSAFMFFVAHYAQLRSELFEAERQLNLTTHGRLVRSRLGRSIVLDSVTGALAASICSFCGALLPLIVGVLMPIARWLAIATALVALAVLGWGLALTVHGRPLRWAGGLVLGGGALAYIGMRLRLIC
jgi:predicted membrane protein (TIGR00267 family)